MCSFTAGCIYPVILVFSTPGSPMSSPAYKNVLTFVHYIILLSLYLVINSKHVHGWHVIRTYLLWLMYS